MGKKSTPKPPDYTAAAEATAESSRENTNTQNFANRPNQNTPFGSTSWDTRAVRDPATGQMVTEWTQNTSLTPEAQAALDSQLALQQGRSDIAGGMMDRVASEFSPTVDFGDFDEAGGRVTGGKFRGGLGNAASYTGRAGDALMSQFNERMQPKFERDTSHLDATLRARGLRPGDEAYDRALDDQRESQSDQFNQAMYQAQQLESAEGSRLQDMDQQSIDAYNKANAAQFGQDLQTSQYDTQRRQQQIAETLQQRGWSLNEINALLTGQQVGMPSMPSFNTAGRSETTNYSGAAQNQWNSDMDVFNAQQAQFANIMGAVTSPFSFAMGG